MAEPINRQKRAVSSGGIIVILAMLTAFAPLATDMYLPAFHLLEKYFNVPEGGVEGSLSVFFLGLACGQAVYGPMIDRYGRLRPLMVGVSLYVVATVLCLVVTDIRFFMLLRFLQAAGGAAGMVIGRAIIRDLYDDRESARALSLMMAIVTLAPILGPIVGGFVVTHMGWRAVFVIMLLFGLSCWVLAWRYLPETLPPEARRRTSLGGVFRTWGTLLGTRAFVVPAILGGMAQACMFAFITGSPFVFMQLHHADEQTYGLLFAAIACALIVGASINRRLLRRFPPARLLAWALRVNAAAGICTVLSVSLHSLPLLFVPLWLTISTLGFIGANAAAVALSASMQHVGSGSALIGVLQFSLAFVVSSVVAATQNGTAYPMTFAMAICGTTAAVLWKCFYRAKA
ncbi:DHA1 family bicyclomycin/chloramphenicol resistance-like MFS transporter [Kerstersia gyiorum]|jgi:DHA1 family bicyclomycin/chloramphenicol resistance-like MFS transporter|uniref:Bcr/CflA family efflux transporter n=1 Tax=Kerstersia gyiorum TaxID=206506 RepID=A0A4Q7N0K2_9BURK|nr:multidrug effflux MFS transporter [Kerstersia gyiorum]KAB0542759.1 multidrug effflux MFS transporter [Kerstersia gyiorum]MCH4271373.1 multidrug effflux MFS transporter [Kerstersia gyiorum]MCI1229625.1 multidrug effflux MFS transporter [Kerstersia gyiorum]RZS73995.1 DHA1 family bicyclomycin/chloramphenicol resistance-like MFS transporter [Kerstersia gyiorum]